MKLNDLIPRCDGEVVHWMGETWDPDDLATMDLFAHKFDDAVQSARKARRQRVEAEKWVAKCADATWHDDKALVNVDDEGRFTVELRKETRYGPWGKDIAAAGRAAKALGLQRWTMSSTGLWHGPCDCCHTVHEARLLSAPPARVCKVSARRLDSGGAK